MKVELILWSILLLLLVKAYGIRAREMVGDNQWNHGNEKRMTQDLLIRYPSDTDAHLHKGISTGDNVLRLPTMDHARQEHDGHGEVPAMDIHVHLSSHMDHMDPSVRVFFTLKDLKVGKMIPIYFPRRDPLTYPHLLHREQADSIPFSLEDLPYLLQFFSLSEDSSQAKAMKETLRDCEIEAIQGEIKFCATSLESSLDFAQSILGLDSHLQMIKTTYISKSSTLFQNYTIFETPKEIPTPRMVACHTLPYPYIVFYCHRLLSETKVFKVQLVGENGDEVDALAVCHMDTSHFSPNHISFQLLGFKPGTMPVCHFFPDDNLVLVPAPTQI
ncbi:hypothetical protein SLE2022_201510 [Rubroshorea leprosula]